MLLLPPLAWQNKQGAWDYTVYNIFFEIILHLS